MGYVDENLVPGEEIIYRAHLHLIIFLSGAAFVLLGTAVVAVGLFYNLIAVWILGALLLAYGLCAGLVRYVRYVTSEFAVTNKRVLIKLGLVRRHTLELLLSRLETIGVEQGLMARIFNYGTIVVTGTGGTREPFPQISRPLEFRRQVQSAASNWQPVTSSRLAARRRVERSSAVSSGRKQKEPKVPPPSLVARIVRVVKDEIVGQRFPDPHQLAKPCAVPGSAMVKSRSSRARSKARAL